MADYWGKEMVRYCKLNNTDRQNSSNGNPHFNSKPTVEDLVGNNEIARVLPESSKLSTSMKMQDFNKQSLMLFSGNYGMKNLVLDSKGV